MKAGGKKRTIKIRRLTNILTMAVILLSFTAFTYDNEIAHLGLTDKSI